MKLAFEPRCHCNFQNVTDSLVLERIRSSVGCRRRDGGSQIWKLSFLLIWTEKKKKKQSGAIFLSSNCRQSAKIFGGKKTLGSDFEDRLRQRWRPKHLTRASSHRTLLIGWRRLCDEIFSKEFALLRKFTLKLKAQIRVVGIDMGKQYLGANQLVVITFQKLK